LRRRIYAKAQRKKLTADERRQTQMEEVKNKKGKDKKFEMTFLFCPLLFLSASTCGFFFVFGFFAPLRENFLAL